MAYEDFEDDVRLEEDEEDLREEDLREEDDEEDPEPEYIDYGYHSEDEE